MGTTRMPILLQMSLGSHCSIRPEIKLLVPSATLRDHIVLPVHEARPVISYSFDCCLPYQIRSTVNAVEAVCLRPAVSTEIVSWIVVEHQTELRTKEECSTFSK